MKQIIRDFYDHLTARIVLGFLVLSGAGALASAFVAEYVFKLLPCILCLYQRVPYAAVIFLGLAGFFGPARYRAHVLAICSFAFTIGAGIALYQVGVEQHWWLGTEACRGQLDTSSIEALRAQIAGSKLVRCDQVAWSLFGISMAGYNIPTSLGLAGISIYGIILAKRKP